jgi:hypothetical protein
MTLTRRKALLTAGTTLTALLSGCGATQQEFSFTATPGRITQQVLSNAGYNPDQQEEIIQQRTVEAAGQERDVTVTNYLRTYTRSISQRGISRELVAAIFTSPSISIVGQQFNPLADLGLKELLERTQGRFSDYGAPQLQEVTRSGEFSIQSLATETTVGVFSAVTAGTPAVDIEVLISRFKHDGDYIILRGGYPQSVTETERQRVRTLFENIAHDSSE